MYKFFLFILLLVKIEAVAESSADPWFSQAFPACSQASQDIVTSVQKTRDIHCGCNQNQLEKTLCELFPPVAKLRNEDQELNANFKNLSMLSEGVGRDLEGTYREIEDSLEKNIQCLKSISDFQETTSPTPSCSPQRMNYFRSLLKSLSESRVAQAIGYSTQQPGTERALNLKGGSWPSFIVKEDLQDGSNSISNSHSHGIDNEVGTVKQNWKRALGEARATAQRKNSNLSEADLEAKVKKQFKQELFKKWAQNPILMFIPQAQPSPQQLAAVYEKILQLTQNRRARLQRLTTSLERFNKKGTSHSTGEDDQVESFKQQIKVGSIFNSNFMEQNLAPPETMTREEIVQELLTEYPSALVFANIRVIKKPTDCKVLAQFFKKMDRADRAANLRMLVMLPLTVAAIPGAATAAQMASPLTLGVVTQDGLRNVHRQLNSKKIDKSYLEEFGLHTVQLEALEFKSDSETLKNSGESLTELRKNTDQEWKQTLFGFFLNFL